MIGGGGLTHQTGVHWRQKEMRNTTFSPWEPSKCFCRLRITVRFSISYELYTFFTKRESAGDFGKFLWGAIIKFNSPSKHAAHIAMWLHIPTQASAISLISSLSLIINTANPFWSDSPTSHAPSAHKRGTRRSTCLFSFRHLQRLIWMSTSSALLLPSIALAPASAAIQLLS